MTEEKAVAGSNSAACLQSELCVSAGMLDLLFVTLPVVLLVREPHCTMCTNAPSSVVKFFTRVRSRRASSAQGCTGVQSSDA
jgi:hypothetical protein